ncbi:MAG: beta-ketoacyl-ACP synthase II [Candidatus Marinimicrobia bacterium]|nr:beta-ketoacyl-ACP synthase II [Candidatus Neomarinimicrobiota bacterium]
MKHRRVVITGMGALAPNGNNVEQYWNALLAGKSGIGPITSYDTEDHSVKIAGELSIFNPIDYLDPREVRRLDRFSILGLIAAQEAVNHSGLDLDSIDLERVGVTLGTGVGGIQTLEEQHSVYMDRGPKRVSPLFVPKMIANIGAAHLSIKFGFKGPNQTIITACSSATDAIGVALRLLHYGDADVMISGGAEASVTPLTVSGFANMKALSKSEDDPVTVSRPFDLTRSGFVLGEGAGLLVLETLEHAKNRGATILAELAGYASTDDAYHITAPAPDGAIRAMRLAIKDAGLASEDIDYINAHGTSTSINDRNETIAIREVFGDHAYNNLKVSSTKSMTGHLLGATGAIEAIAVVKAIENNIAPPTINQTTPDPDCDLNYIPNKAESFPIEAALSNTFGFGGHNGVICIRRWHDV